MESTEILAKANTAEGAPYNWLVFPLVRRSVIVGILGWILGIICGGLFFAVLVPIMIPHNYQAGIVSAIMSTLILGVVLFVCLGSLWTLITDVRRLMHPTEHLIVITPEEFVKQEGTKIINVPLEHVKYVTARGAAPVDRSLAGARADTQVGSVGENVGSLVTGRRMAESGRRGLSGRRMRAPNSLAFIDTRTDKEVVVATDKSYGDPYLIAAHLKQYAAARVANNPA